MTTLAPELLSRILSLGALPLVPMGSNLLNYIDEHYDTWVARFGLGIVLFLPIKLSLTYAALIPTVLLWGLKNRNRFQSALREVPLGIPFLLFVLAATVSALFGRKPFHSISGLFDLAFFSMTIFATYEVAKRVTTIRIITTLLLSQGIAALHTIIEAGVGDPLSLKIVGALSESGQITLSLILGIGLLLYLQESRESSSQFSPSPLLSVIGGIVVSTLILGLAFSTYLALHPVIQYSLCGLVMLGAGCGAVLLARGIWGEPIKSHLIRYGLTFFHLPLIASALVVNLKRGPWMGVLIGSIILLFVYRRRFIVPLLLVATCVIVFVGPVRDRIQHSSDHFFIAGGRSAMWQIGVELSSRYPLGIGFSNSAFLRDYDDNIPRVHNHFHNSYLNIIVETGWLCFGVFLWWLFELLRAAFSCPHHSKDSIIICSIGCSLVAWMVAGLVEYNFGDSEVQLLFFVLVGVLGALIKQHRGSDSIMLAGLPKPLQA